MKGFNHRLGAYHLIRHLLGGVVIALLFLTPAPALAANILDNETGGDCSSFGSWDQNAKTCTLNSDVHDTVRVRSSNITIDGADHTIYRPTGNWGPIALYLAGVSEVTIKNLNISSNFGANSFTGPGIHVQGSSNNTFTNVSVKLGRPGIKFLFGSNNNVVSDSEITGNRDSGIYCETSTGNKIQNNSIHSNFSQGIVFGNCSNNEITGNTISNHSKGMTLSGNFGAGSFNNLVLNNNFINNNSNISSSWGGGHTFSQPLPIGGNYWSSFDSPAEGCVDSDNNKICDSPYQFSGGQDDYPWVSADAWNTQAKEPIIIIPGILGTKLNRASDNEEVWINISKLTDLFNDKDAYLNDLILDSSGINNENTEIEVGEILDQVGSLTVYGNLINSFPGYTPGVDLFILNYDWRKDLSSEVDRLANIIDSAIDNSGQSQVNIVAHSMGGLLTKEYLRQYGDNLVNKIILAGSPQIGSPKALKALSWGDDFDIGAIGIGLNPERAKIISQNMPAVYQLLPSRKYLDVYGPYIKDFRAGNSKPLNYKETADFMLENPSDKRNALLINKADQLHQDLDTHSWPSNKVYNLIGCQNPSTIGEIYIYDNDKYKLKFVDGDGTVPLISAIYSSDQMKQAYFALESFTRANHMGLIKKTEPLELIRNIVSGEVTELPNGISTSLSDCENKFSSYIFSTHSPVELHVYDEEGNHLGPKENGDLEFGIEGGSYHQIGDNNFAIVPDGAGYHIIIESTDTGEFDFTVENYKEGELSRAQSFLGISIEDKKLTASTDIDSQFSNLILEVDSDGDGLVEETLSPTATVSAGQTSDITPPEISINSPAENLYLRQQIIEINVSVTDDSEVAKQIVELDGELAESEQIDTLNLALGLHTLKVKAWDIFGNFAQKEIQFEIIATIESTTAVIQRGVELGYIEEKAAKDLIKKLEKATKEESKIAKEEEKDKKNSDKKIEKIEKKIDKIMGEQFLKELDKEYNKDQVSDFIKNILIENIQSLL